MRAWPRRTMVFHRIAAVALGLVVALLGVVIHSATAAAVAAPLGAAGYYLVATWRYRRRRSVLSQPFDPAHRAILAERVPFYRSLEGEARERFEDDVRIFLLEQVITGAADHQVDQTTRLLVAASAAMLTNGLPEWEWPRVRDIVVYPHAFDERYDVRQGGEIAGQVHLHGPIIVSERDLKLGFRRRDGYNVGLHELAHVIDMQDGSADGVPVDPPFTATAPWIQVVAHRLAKLRRGQRSPLRDYAATHEAEVFAVAVELFFEQPDELARRDAELFELLAAYFNQDPRHPGQPLPPQPSA